MHSIQFDPRTERELDRLAGKTGRSADDLIAEAVREFLEEQGDIAAADAAYDRYLAGEEKTVSLDELGRRLGLEG